MPRSLYLLVLSFLCISCGTDDMSFLLGQSKSKVKRSPITEINGFQKIGETRIKDPKTPEDFAINEIQDYYDIHQRFRNYLASQNIFLPDMFNRYDVATPLVYSPRKVLEAVNLIKKEMPPELLNIYQKKVDFPLRNQFDQKVLMHWNKIILNATEQAKRWQQLIAPQVKYWRAFHKKDVRGYVFFRDTEKLDEKLLNFSAQEESFQLKAKEAYVQICHNNGVSVSTCLTETRDAHFPERVFSAYYRYLSKAKENYEAYFKIQTKVENIRWLDKNVIHFNLYSLSSADSTLMFKNLIEANWRIDEQFKLKVNFVEEPGGDLATVSIGNHSIGHVINNKNLYLPTYDLVLPDRQKVAIHELGHLLGFSDCYVEFVDTITGDAVYYELSESNIMCSLAGHVQDQHFKELKKAYD